jgi:hypothetical protein
VCIGLCVKKDIIFQVSAMHDAMVKEYRSDQHKKYISMELRPNAIICAFYTNGVGGVAEQLRLQNPTTRVRPKKGLL